MSSTNGNQEQLSVLTRLLMCLPTFPKPNQISTFCRTPLGNIGAASVKFLLITLKLGVFSTSLMWDHQGEEVT